jgi:DNA-directed RNA polymerase sigma subunit (sigma70/sigma32)
MSNRRKPPTKLSSMNGPDNATKRSSVSKKSVKPAAEKTKPRINSLSRSQSQTVKLIAPVMKPAQDLTLEQLLEMEPPSVQEELSQEEREKVAVERVEEAKEALGRLENEIISSLFPPTGLPQSMEEIASRLGMTLKEVREVADNALRGLRGTKSSRPRLSTVWN